MIYDDNFYTVQGFMINKLKLKGNELSIYAIIYGFSQTGSQRYTGSLKYLMDWINTRSKQTVMNCLNSLLEKKYIDKEVYYKNNIKYCSYGVVQNLDHQSKICNEGGPKIGHNNINIKEEEEKENKNPFTFYENNFGLINSYIAMNINTYLDDGLTEELIIEAMKEAVDNNARTWKYVKTILNNCLNENITTAEQYRAKQKEFKNKKSNKTTTTKKQEVNYNTDFSEYDQYARRE